jgi:hypothetical protein
VGDDAATIPERFTDQADHGGFVGEDAHDAGAAFDLLVQPLDAYLEPLAGLVP